MEQSSSEKKKRKLLIFGLGFTGSRLAKKLVEKKDWSVVGTVRNRKETNVKNVEVVIFDIGEFKRVREILRSGTVTHVLITAPPMKTGEGDPVLAALKDDLRKIKLEWCGYLSTTGVYGDCAGEVVDETAKLCPVSKRSERRVVAEDSWSKLGLPIHIFRLPGIYGPGRGTLARVRQGRTRPIFKKGQVFNRVHVDDIVSALELSMENPSKVTPVVYNVVDDLPAPQHVVTAYAYKILNRNPIPDPIRFEDAEMSKMARSFYSSSRRATAQKLKTELGWKPKYPTYVEGFRAQMEEEEDSKKKKNNTLPLMALGTTFLLTAAACSFYSTPGLIVAAASSVAVMLRRRNNTACLVVDNGSVRAGATKQLRNITSRLRARLDLPVEVVPVSARWSDRVDPKELDGKPAELLSNAVDRLARNGIRRFVLVPLFFGPSKTVKSFIPKIMSEKKDIEWNLADELCGGLWWCRDLRIARILCERSLQYMMQYSSHRNVTVFVVDHGSPSPEVTSVRNRTASQVESMLKMEIPSSTDLIVRACSMERRAGSKYAFADPLLEHVLEDDDLCRDRLVILALMFVSPGKHAGPGGDISDIVSNASCASKNIVITDLVGTHPLLDDLLLDRFVSTSIGRRTTTE